MITPEHDAALSYHPLTPGRGQLHEEARAAAKRYCAHLDGMLPPSREASLAFTALEESLMWANKALALNDPHRPPTAWAPPSGFANDDPAAPWNQAS